MLRFPAASFLLLLLVLLLALFSSTTKSQSVVSDSTSTTRIHHLFLLHHPYKKKRTTLHHFQTTYWPFNSADLCVIVPNTKHVIPSGMMIYPESSLYTLGKPPKGPRLLQNLHTEWINAYFVFQSKGPTKEVQRKQAAQEFWEYQWKEHGDYSGLSVQDFFNTAFTLFNNLGDVYGKFIAQGLIEGDGNIDVTKATQMLTQVLKVKPYLKCVFDKRNKERLFEIEIKYDRATLTRVPHPEYSNCTGIKVGLKA
ncbi:hypothetical protein MKW92_013867 [Papaver armeniacum]|nr:hypothetical protein MKW92_013867 [Papaver armeniacum]